MLKKIIKFFSLDEALKAGEDFESYCLRTCSIIAIIAIVILAILYFIFY